MSTAQIPFDLDRFVRAQHLIYAAALSKLQQSKKRSHWMWFVFPRVERLGSSEMAKHYAIKSRTEVAAYAAHALLGSRLLECTATMLGHSRKSAHDIFGSPDDMKFQSSMTMFECATEEKYYGAALDRVTTASEVKERLLSILTCLIAPSCSTSIIFPADVR